MVAGKLSVLPVNSRRNSTRNNKGQPQFGTVGKHERWLTARGSILKGAWREWMYLESP